MGKICNQYSDSSKIFQNLFFFVFKTHKFPSKNVLPKALLNWQVWCKLITVRMGCPGFQVAGMIKGFFLVWIFDARIFWVEIFGKYFLSVQNNLKICVSAWVSQPCSSANNKVQPNLFGFQKFLRLGNLVWVFFCGVANFWSMDLFWFWFLPPFNHPRLLKSVLYSSRRIIGSIEVSRWLTTYPPRSHNFSLSEGEVQSKLFNKDTKRTERCVRIREVSV